MIDRNPLRVRENPNSSAYSGVFVTREWTPRHPPQWVSNRLRAQVRAGIITWRFAVIAQARYLRLINWRWVIGSAGGGSGS